MGTVSAIPENLYRYADTCTKGAEQLQTWVRTVLEPAVRAYRNGGGTCFVIDGQVAQQVAAAYYTDRDVKVVGLAFARAGGHLVRGPGVPIRVDDKTVTATFQKMQLNAAQQAQIDAGAALAKKMMGTKVTELSGLLEELRRHGKDPYFNAGFFNGLDGQRLEKAITEIPALVSAYSSGLLEGRVHQRVINQLTRPVVKSRIPVSLDVYYTSAAQKMQFLDALAANPAAARHFAQSLDNYPVGHLFEGPMAKEPWWRNKLVGALAAGMPTWPQGAQPLSNSEGLSYELKFAGHLPYPSVDPLGMKYSRAQAAVLSWAELNRDIIFREARRNGIDPRAIIAAVAWEAMNNVQPYNPIPPWTPIPPLPSQVPLKARTSVGPGKVHMNAQIVEDVENLGKMPHLSMTEREALLRTDEGSIRYIAAIQGAFAEATARFPAHKQDPPPHKNVQLLTHVYQGAGVADGLAKWNERLTRPGALRFENDMAMWAIQPSTQKFLDDAVRAPPGTSPPG